MCKVGGRVSVTDTFAGSSNHWVVPATHSPRVQTRIGMQESHPPPPIPTHQELLTRTRRHLLSLLRVQKEGRASWVSCSGQASDEMRPEVETKAFLLSFLSSSLLPSFSPVFLPFLRPLSLSLFSFFPFPVTLCSLNIPENELSIMNLTS